MLPALASGLILLASTASALPTSELFEGLDLDELSVMAGDERTFVSLNSTYIAYGVAAGAVLILTLAVGLYLYDYYYGTSRSDPVPTSQADYGQYYDPSQYQQLQYQQLAENYRLEIITIILSSTLPLAGGEILFSIWHIHTPFLRFMHC